MRIGIRWAKGLLKIQCDENETIGDLYTTIAKMIHVDSSCLELHSSMSFASFSSQAYDKNLTLYQSRIKNGDIIFLKVYGKLPDIPVAQMTLKSDIIDEFKEKGVKIPENIKNMRKEFGTRTITGSLHDLKEKYMPSITYQNESSCYAIKVGEEAVKRFITVSLNERFNKHRFVYLFGRLCKRTGKVTIHCALAPPQTNYSDGVVVDESYDMSIPLMVAKVFGMRLLGMAVSHNGSDKLPMPAYLIDMAAKNQIRYGEYFTTLIVTPKGLNDIEMVAYQVNDGVVNLKNKDLFEMGDTQDYIKFKEPIRVFGKKVMKCHCNLCLCAVRVRKVNSKIPVHEFPSPQQEPTKVDVKQHLDNHSFCPDWMKLFDFNFLVFLTQNNIFKINDVSVIYDCIMNKSDIPDYILKNIKNYIKKSE